VPGALAVSSFYSSQDFTRTGLVVHKSSDPVLGPVEIGIENSPATKSTWLSIVNPGDDTLELALTARRGDGSKACDTKIKINPGQMIWKTAQSLMPCQRAGSPNYTLHIDPLDGEAVIHAYYDYGNLLFATAPVHEVIAEEVESPMGQAAVTKSAVREASSAPCRPVFDPIRAAPDFGGID